MTTETGTLRGEEEEVVHLPTNTFNMYVINM
jgi:hypothetical protein